MSTKPAFIIPDWKLKASDAAYHNVAAALRRQNYEVLGQDIIWFSSLMAQWTDELSRAMNSQNAPATVFAFGLGGMIALAASTRVPIERLILCSPRGYYREYLPQCTPGDTRWMGDARAAEFAQLSSQELLASMQVKHGSIIIDEAEHIGRQAHKQWVGDIVSATGWEVTALPRQRYGVMSPGYQGILAETVKGLAHTD
jgi:pimeloyl-ACP methyl ester carboxylesterase